MAATTTGPVTFAELEQLPETPGYRYELHHGELVKVAPPKNRHYRIQWCIFWLLVPTGRITGEVFVELGFRALPEHEYRQADVAFVSKDRWERSSPDGNLAGAPELVIEVLSPSNSKGEILDKERLCLENGSLEFWIVDPIRRQVKVSTPDGRALMYGPGEQIPLLFGGSLAVDSVFERYDSQRERRLDRSETGGRKLSGASDIGRRADQPECRACSINSRMA